MHLTGALSAWITIDERQSDEYAVVLSDDGLHATCWISSEAGKPFQVKVTDVPATPTSYMVCVDGISVGGKVVTKPGYGHPVNMSVDGKRISDDTICPFMFASIKQSDDDALLGQSVDGVGEITISITQCVIKRISTSAKRYNGLPAEKTFHERMKKGIDHQTSYGEPLQSRVSKRSYDTKAIGATRTFTFRYRPLAVLQANAIAPPPPPTYSAKTEAEDDSDVEIVETTKFMKRERKPNVKKELDGEPVRKKLKQEKDVEVIDLT